MLPYAGANKYAFKDLEKEFPPWFTIHPLELPGRGNRFAEQLISNLEDAVQDIYSQIVPFSDLPYAIFGHSLGAVLGYLVTRKFEEMKLNVPRHLFCSGRAGLWSNVGQNWSKLGSEEFWDKILDLGGLHVALSEDQEMRTLFEPILRADFYMIDQVKAGEVVSASRINVKMTVILGNEDKFTSQPCDWGTHTLYPPKVVYFNGGHFYFNQNGTALARLIDRTLSTVVEDYC
jgi:surfactin synthase thioesterase subunit